MLQVILCILVSFLCFSPFNIFDVLHAPCSRFLLLNNSKKLSSGENPSTGVSRYRALTGGVGCGCRCRRGIGSGRGRGRRCAGVPTGRRPAEVYSKVGARFSCKPKQQGPAGQSYIDAWMLPAVGWRCPHCDTWWWYSSYDDDTCKLLPWSSCKDGRVLGSLQLCGSQTTYAHLD